ncbi:hypothetical protein HaLaN_14447, partial [Haematococcus lacustris]
MRLAVLTWPAGLMKDCHGCPGLQGYQTRPRLCIFTQPCIFHGKPKLLEKANARRTAHRMMAKKKRKGSDKKHKALTMTVMVTISSSGPEQQPHRANTLSSQV